MTTPLPARACDALVEEALIAGGLDNVTVIVIDPLGDPPSDDEEVTYVEERVVGVPEDTEAEVPDTTSAPIASATPAKDRGGKHHRSKQKGRMAPFIWALAFILILAAAGFGFYAFAQNSYYIIAENGIVSVYRGLPGEVAGISVSWLESQAPDIDVTKLTPMVQNSSRPAYRSNPSIRQTSLSPNTVSKARRASRAFAPDDRAMASHSGNARIVAAVPDAARSTPTRR